TPIWDFRVPEMIDRIFELTDLKPSTRRTYRHAIAAFVVWSAGRPIERTILVLYKNHLRERSDLAPKTANLYLAAARTALHRLFVVGILPFDASESVKSFEVGKAHTRPPITDAQVARAFRYARRINDRRLALILNLLYRQGLRQKEIVDLRIEHFKEQDAT